MNTTDGIYADFRKVEQGMKLYMKLSQPVAYATIKLIQFLARAAKENIFDKDMVENFSKFIKATNGEYTIYRMPYINELSREQAVENAKNYFDTAGIKYCVMDSVNNNDKALHISVARKDEQKFNVMFTDYLKEQLSGGKKTADDLMNLTDGRTTIISIPDAALDNMKDALAKVNANFAELPDLIPDDGEKQLRIASADINITKECYEAYRRSIMKKQPEASDIPDMKIFSEEDYIDTARETPTEYIKDALSEEMSEKLKKYEQMDSGEMEKEVMKWEFEIKDSKCMECQALRANMAYTEISIDRQTLVRGNSSSLIIDLENKFPNYFFARIPGTYGKGIQILMLPKNQVFKVNGEKKERYIAFANNQRKVKVFNCDGSREYELSSGKALHDIFDEHGKQKNMQKDLNKSVTSVFENVVPKAAPVK